MKTKIPKLLKETWAEFSRDNAMRLSAALSYYSIFSIAPLLLIAIGIAGIAYGQKAAQGEIAGELSSFLGGQAAKAVESILQSAGKTSGGATIVGFVTLLVGASTVFAQLKDSLNVIWKVRLREGLGVGVLVREKLLNFGLVLAVGFVLLLSVAATTAFAAVAGLLERRFGVPTFVSGLAGIGIPLLLEGVMFATMFKIIPDAVTPWRHVWTGAAVTAVLFEIGKIGLSFYLGRGSATSSFGAAGSVVLLLLWIYYASCILFLGGEFTVVYARERGWNVRPSHLAEPTEVWTPEGRKPIECAEAGGKRKSPEPVPPSLFSSDGEALSQPSREHLGLLFGRRGASRRQPQTSVPMGQLLSEMAVAVGAGIAAGVVLRVLDRKPETSAWEHLRLGSKGVIDKARALRD